MEQRVVTKLIVVVPVFIAEREGEHALADQGLDRVLEQSWVAPVGETAGHPTDQPEAAIQPPQQQPSGIRCDDSAIEPGHNLVPFNRFKFEQCWATLCLHRGLSGIAVSDWRIAIFRDSPPRCIKGFEKSGLGAPFMTVRILLPLLAIAAAAAFIPDSRAESPATPNLDREAVRKIVREYLLEHPEVIEEAIQVLQAKRGSREQDRVRAALREHDKALRSHPMSPVSGNPKGDVTLVEFFDYQCGYCKRSLKSVKDLLETDRQLRIVWKEFPILGPVSRFAARAAMASEKQGRYLEFHVAVMGSRGKLTEDRVMAIAGSVGLDVQRLRRDMEDPAIEEYLDETIRLAQVLDIRGTPAFVIGDTLVPGAVDGVRLKELIAKARSGGWGENRLR